MLDTNRLEGVAQEVNLRNLSCLQAMKHVSESIYPGFETQAGLHQESKTGVGMTLQNVLFKTRIFVLSKLFFSLWNSSENL